MEKLIPFASVTLYCGPMQAKMEATLIGPDEIELCTSIGGEVPKVTRGTFHNQMLRSDLWYKKMIDDGFVPAITLEQNSHIN